MSEDKLVADAGKIKADIIEVKAWYKEYPFYAGLIAGAIACGFLVHVFKL